MAAHLLDPFRLDASQRARVQAAGFHQFGGDDPAPHLARDERARPKVELDAARAQVLAPLAVGLVQLQANVAEQAGQQRLVHLLEGRLALVQAPALFRHRGQQLRMHIAPFAQANMRQEVGAALLLQLPVGLLVRDRFFEPLPQLDPAQKLGLLVHELAMCLVGGLLGLLRAVSRVLHGQRAGDDQHLAQTLLVARSQDHPRHARVKRQLGQLATNAGELVRLVERAQLLQQLIAVGDGTAQRRLDKRERLDIGQAQRLHAQNDRCQRRAQDFRIGEAHAAQEITFLVQADADTVRHPATSAGTLVGRRLRDRFDLELLDLVAVRIALDARQPRIHHVADARHRQRRLRHVGGQHDAPRVRRFEHPLLLLHGQPREQRQDFRMRRMMLAQRLGSLADLPLARQEHQHVAGPDPAEFVHGVDDTVVQIALPGLLGTRGAVGRRIRLDRPVAHLHRIEPATDLDHGRRLAVAREMLGKALGVDGCRRDDHLQIRPLRQDLAQVADQEVDVEAALVRLVDDDRVVGAQQRIILRLGQQDAVGHQLDRRPGRHRVVEPDLIPDRLAQRRAQLLCDPLGRGGGRNPAGLGVADQPAAGLALACRAPPDRQGDLWQLGGLARAGFAGNDDDLVGLQCPGDLFAPCRDGQGLRKRDFRYRIGKPCRLRRTGLARPTGRARRARGGLRGPLGGIRRNRGSRGLGGPGRNRFGGALC